MPGFASALRGPQVAVIAEIKRRSPSAGAINPALDPVALARQYAAGHAAAISVLTEPEWFGGSLTDLERVVEAVGVPVLRKDFLVAEEQLLEARAAGASAVLLIVRAMVPARLAELTAFAAELGMDALVEAHGADEVARAADAGARVIGVNSRDLDTLAVELPSALAHIASVPSGCVAVAESGISSAEGVTAAAAAGADAVLVGAALAGTAAPGRLLATLVGVERRGR